MIIYDPYVPLYMWVSDMILYSKIINVYKSRRIPYENLIVIRQCKKIDCQRKIRVQVSRKILLFFFHKIVQKFLKTTVFNLVDAIILFSYFFYTDLSTHRTVHRFRAKLSSLRRVFFVTYDDPSL